MHPKKAKAMMTKEQAMLADGSIKQDQYDKQLLSKIGKSQLDELSSKDLQVLALLRDECRNSFQDPQMIKNEDVSEKEYAAVSQQLSKLPGVNTSMDWDRKYRCMAIL